MLRYLIEPNRKCRIRHWVAHYASVDIVRLTGGSSGSPGSVGVITGSVNTRCNAEDVNSTADTVNPIQIPASGTHYSYWVSTQLYATTLPATEISNIIWYTGGSNPYGTGVDLYAQEAGPTYAPATGNLGITGNLAGGSPVEAFSNYTSSTPLSVTGTLLSGGSTGRFGDIVIFQFYVVSSASPGVTPKGTFSWSYDES